MAESRPPYSDDLRKMQRPRAIAEEAESRIRRKSFQLIDTITYRRCLSIILGLAKRTQVHQIPIK
jgi:hypothetical protein